MERRYGPSIDGADPTAVRIATAGDAAVGLVQWFRLRDEPQYLADLRRWLPVPEEAWSLDFLLGSAAARGRGLGGAMVGAALTEIGRGPVVVPVHERNTASAALLARCGFTAVAAADLDPDGPTHSRKHRVHRRG